MGRRTLDRLTVRLWIVVFAAGLACCAPPEPTSTQEEGGLVTNEANVILQDRQGSPWVGTLGGSQLRAELAPPADAPRALTQYVHRAWTSEDGLPTDAVWSITQTRDGYLWVGTLGGLARFDGVRFVPFTTRNTPALPNNGVSALYEDARGTLWIGTLGGLVRYRDGRFATLTTADGLPSDNVWAVSGAPDGTLWVGTLGGLARYRDGRFTTYTTRDGLLTDDVRAVSVAKDGAVWVGTYGGGAHRLADGRVRAYSLVGSAPGPWVHRILAGGEGAVWVGVGQGQADRSPHQLLRLEGGRFQMPAPEHDLYSVRALHQARDGALWVGTYGGGLVRTADGALEPFAAADGLTDDRVQAIFQDRDGNVWVGTMGGLDLLRPTSPFTTVAVEEGLPDDNVRGVVQDAVGTVWVATADGLARIDPSPGSGQAADGVAALTARDGLPEPFVQSVWAARDGAVWLGGQNSVTRYADGAFTRYRLPASWPDGVVRSIVEDRAGQLWLGSVGAGLVRFSPEGSRALTTDDGLAHNGVTALLASRDGGLWVGTASGLSRVEGGRVRPFRGEEAFDGINVRSLYADADGTLWVGTYTRGLLRLRDGRVTTYTTREGLHDDGVWSVLEDDREHLWMSSNRGVSRVSKAALEAVAAGRQRALTPVVYGVADGMKTAEANGASKPSGWRSRDGRMWFATQRGVVVVDPANVDRAVPTPIVEGVRPQRGEAARAGEVVTLPALARDFTVDYTTLSFADPERLRFRYRLDGFTDGWVEAEGRREAVFTNVPAGPYAFRVAAQNGSGVWAEGEPLALSVAPFVWETRWFRLLVVLVGVGLVALGARTQVRRQWRREAALEAEVEARTDELRQAKETTEAQAAQLRELDEAKSAFFANVSHEFRTPLTLTLGPLDDVLAGEYGPVPDDASEPLGLARRSARRVLDLINQILDVSRLEAGSTPLRAGELDLGAFVEAQVEAFAPLAAHQRVVAEVTTPEAPLRVWADADHLGTILANLLSNAFKFTPAGGAVRVTVEADGAAARVTVRDTGPGIAAADLPHVFDRFYQAAGAASRPLGSGIGLALAHELAALHGGALAVESTVDGAEGEPSGSVFTLALPLGRDHLAPDQVDSRLWDGAPVAGPAAGDGTDGEPLALPPEVDLDDDVTTVLVADDQPDIRAFVRRHLEGAGYRVVEAADGEEALARVRQRLPDLVVSDVMMPRLDGLGLCRALKADPETDSIPVVLLTAKAAPEDRIDGLGEQADDYLTKPFDPAELRARVSNLIEGRKRLRERFRKEGIALALGDSDGAPGALPEPEAVVSADDAFLAGVRAAVEAHLGDETFSVERLAEAVAMSRGHLHRQLTALAGQTPTEVIRTLRLERAAQLLAARTGMVSEVAYAVGFKSVGHFSDSFLEAHGCRPSAYAEREGAASAEPS